MKERELHYFAVGNTARGYYSLYDSNLVGLKKIFVLVGHSRKVKSALLSRLCKRLTSQNLHCQLIHSSANPNFIESLIVEELSIGIVDGRIPEVNQAKRRHLIERYIDLDEKCHCLLSEEHKDNMDFFMKQADDEVMKAYEAFSQALRIHDEWEAIFIDNMNFAEADSLTDEMVTKLLYRTSQLGKGKTYHRFLGAATPIGSVDFVPNLTKELNHRYFIKGRPGSGKSTMLKKIAQQAEARGFDVEIYHCGFDPHSLDMIIVRELDFAIFDSTAPHEYQPERKGDVIIDVYARCICPNTDEDYSLDIANVSERYRNKVRQATAHLAQAKSIQDQMEEIYSGSMDFSMLAGIEEQILTLIKQFSLKS